MEGRFLLPLTLAIRIELMLILIVQLIMLSYGPPLWLPSHLEVFNQLLQFHALPLLRGNLFLEGGDLVEHLEEAIVHLPLLLAVAVDLLLLIVVLQLQLLYLQVVLLQLGDEPRLAFLASDLHGLA